VNHRSGKRNDLRPGLDELCIFQGIHMDIRGVKGVFGFNCFGDRIFGAVDQGDWWFKAGKVAQGKPLTGGEKRFDNRGQHLLTSTEDVYLRVRKGRKNRSQRDRMLKVKGAALRAGFWSQVSIASIKKLGGWRVARGVRG
jgi:hypothetical protein